MNPAMSKIADWCASVRRALRGRYVRLLEEEIARKRSALDHLSAEVARERTDVIRLRGEIAELRAENRALINSLLGTAGIPPIETLTAHPAGISPVRRRSWPQIAAAREIESARAARQVNDRTATPRSENERRPTDDTKPRGTLQLGSPGASFAPRTRGGKASGPRTNRGGPELQKSSRAGVPGGQATKVQLRGPRWSHAFRSTGKSMGSVFGPSPERQALDHFQSAAFRTRPATTGF